MSSSSLKGKGYRVANNVLAVRTTFNTYATSVCSGNYANVYVCANIIGVLPPRSLDLTAVGLALLTEPR